MATRKYQFALHFFKNQNYLCLILMSCEGLLTKPGYGVDEWPVSPVLSHTLKR